MARVDTLIIDALRRLPPKPPDSAGRETKKRYSEQLSAEVALALGEELRHRGLKEARPTGPATKAAPSGSERRMAGGIGAKKVDVTWSTEDSGLLLAISIKSINFRDKRGGHFQKNLTNRRGDMLMEAVTLHRRFPYAVLGALFFFDRGAATDNIKLGATTPPRRRATFTNAHARLRLFTGRGDPAARDEQFEKSYIILVDAAPTAAKFEVYEVGDETCIVPMEQVMDDLLKIVADRNPDFYEFDAGRLKKAT